MYKIIKPFINLAHANFAAMSHWLTTPVSARQESTNEFWSMVMASQARFVNEYTEAVLAMLDQGRAVIAGQMEELSEQGERVANELAHSTVRAVAIATQARNDHRDRRIFPLPLPNERRATEAMDRRLRRPGRADRTGI